MLLIEASSNKGYLMIL